MKNIKYFDFKKRPHKPWRILYPISRVAMIPFFRKFSLEIEKVNMEGIKPPYLLLANHASQIDFRILYRAIDPVIPNCVVAIDGFYDFTEFLLRAAGSICKRKFTRDPYILPNIKHVVEELKNIIVLYPEARYSFDGTTSYLSPTTGLLAKKLGVPVVTLISQGNFVGDPQWNKHFNGCHLKGKLECVLTPGQLKEMSTKQINDVLKEQFVYDDFKYQFDNKIKIDYKNRADGLNRILYKCSACNEEGKMVGKGDSIKCEKCGKEWLMTEYGKLKAKDGKDTFTHIPDWYKWERECVNEEVRNGTYRFEDDIEVQTLPNSHKYYKHGKGHLIHDVNGLRFSCKPYGVEKSFDFAPLELESVHIEFGFKKLGDALDISTVEDSYWCHPINHRDVIMKIALATEEIYNMAYKKSMSRRTKSILST